MNIEVSETYSYNQKTVLKETVLDFISNHNIQSLLDIGAGSADTALPYQSAVKNYVAVEQDKARAARLKEAGLLVVINKSFPCLIEDTFDLVLSSHSVPERIEAYEPFVQAAWENVNEQGHLMIITFKGANDTFHSLKNELLPDWTFQQDENFKEMMRVLQSFGRPVMSKVTSCTKTKVPEDITRSICRSLSLDHHQWQKKLLSVLDSRFKDEHGYFFPSEHLVILLKKSVRSI